VRLTPDREPPAVPAPEGELAGDVSIQALSSDGIALK
jgi:hypothetical protein